MKCKYQTNANKIVIILFAVIMLMGCKKEMNLLDELSYIEFTKSEIIVEVTHETKTFRIEVEASPEAREYTSVKIVPDKTTAQNNVHFINTVDVEANNSLGKFTTIAGTNKSYRDVEIIPTNIKEKVVITYTTGDMFIDPDEPENLNKELTVILQPKSEE